MSESVPMSVPLRFIARETPARRGEPVTVGLPWPRGAVRDERQFRLVGPDGSPQVLQVKTLDRWPDGSVRWCRFDFRATVDGRNDGYRLEIGENTKTAKTEERPNATAEDLSIFFRNVGGSMPTDGTTCFELSASEGAAPTILNLTSTVEETGPIRLRVRLQSGQLERGLSVFGHMDCVPGLPVARVQLTIRNSQPADHPGGNWDLGNGGSAYITGLSLKLFPSGWGDQAIRRVSPERDQPFRECQQAVEVYQDSSGGENWRSSNHVNRKREIPLRFRGYKLTADGQTSDGQRATPIITLERDGRFLGVAMPDFWENFPKAITADAGGITLGLFPKQSADVHELQGGEQKTHTFYVAFGKDTVTDEPMVWCRSPLVCHADPEWYAAAGARPYLTPKGADPHVAYLALVDQAIDGPDSFFAKREKIDQFGWRHFGDVYGDHEAVKHKGPTPLISHYNNQYDCLLGFGTQFLRSADPRWYSQMLQMADHSCDIDVYHTDGDKAAYNRGLFWHTYHYVDADTGTHRAYPKSVRTVPNVNLTERIDQLGETAAKLQKAYAVGGGPSASHNYNGGLMLAYFLTGNPLYRDTAIDLAQFVIEIDDPAKTPFRLLSREFTGVATDSGNNYHGPGRASANSLLALITGHRLTGDAKYLEKAEQVIRRVVHPKQNLDDLDLLNAELRWFYTMFLQALGEYLDYKAELGQLDRMYGYARLTLLYYARWMAANERPILDTPDRLQYPTETWAAQDMRKVEVFQFAAKHADGTEKAKYLERAGWFFRYATDKLQEFPTKSLCRPVVLMMRYGWSRAWWQQHPDAAAPAPAVTVSADEFGGWRMFVSQKTKAIKRAKLIVAVGAVAGVVVLAGLVWWLLT
jgi:hypothetical protein